MKYLIAMLLLASCAAEEEVDTRPKFNPGLIDLPLRAGFDRIAADINQALNYTAVEYRDDSSAAVVMSNDPKILEGWTVGLWSHAAETVYIMGDRLERERYSAYGNTFLTEDTRLLILAHEIGHALGLRHADHGIMTPNALQADQGSCYTRIGECIREALIEQAILAP
jgi:hypothetical protein